MQVGDRGELARATCASSRAIRGLRSDRQALRIDAVRIDQATHEAGERGLQNALLVGHRHRVVDDEQNVQLGSLLLRTDVDWWTAGEAPEAAGATSAASAAGVSACLTHDVHRARCAAFRP